MDDVLLFRRREWGRVRGWPDLWRFLWGLRQRSWDAVIDYQGLSRSALCALFAKAPIKGGFGNGRELAWVAYNHPVHVPPTVVHAVARNLYLTNAVLGTDEPYEPPRFRPDAETAAAAEALLAEQGLSGARPLVAVAPVTRWPSKCWPPAFFARTLGLLRQTLGPGAGLWLLGGPEDQAVGERILAETTTAGVRSLIGRTSLPVMVELLKRSALLLSGDSGPMHLAAALQVPTVALFGATDPDKTGPYGPAHHVFRSDLECAPCFRRQCRWPRHRCVEETVSAEAVAQYIASRLP